LSILNRPYRALHSAYRYCRALSCSCVPNDYST